MVKKLAKEDIYKQCNLDIFKVESTRNLKAFDGIMGQQRVQEALEMAVGIEHSSYNIFALGAGGIGKQRLIRNFLSNIAKTKSTPKEYCYVHNFDNPEKPLFIEFNPAEAIVFQKQFNDLIEELKVTIPTTLESDNYKAKLSQIEHKELKKNEEAINKIKNEANQNKIEIIKTPQGFAIVALDPKTNKPMPKEEVEKLSQKEKEIIEKKVHEIQFKLENLIAGFPEQEKDKKAKLKEVEYQQIKKVAAPKLDKMLKTWKENPKAIDFLDNVKEEILSNPVYFYNKSEKEADPLSMLFTRNKSKNDENIFAVNVVIDRSTAAKEGCGAPIVILNDPTYSQLFGKIDYLTQFGSLSTDHSLIRAGALHQANGGYLVVNARPLLETPILWHQIKKVIKSGTLSFNFDNPASGVALITLEPEPIPFNGKIILLGEPDIYNALWEYDPEFKELFKITAEFDSRIPFNENGAKIYAEVATSIVQKENLKHIDKAALGRLVEVGARYAGSQNHLTTNVSFLIDIIREANFLATKNNNKLIHVEDIAAAFEFRKKLRSRVPTYMRDMIKEKTIVIATNGEEIGQINGLSVISINEFMFGQPQRISCSVFQGKRDIIDIESNVKLAGAIYSKGVMILSAFLHSRFSTEELLSFSCALTFEQSYGMIDGDSASAASTFVTMSALAQVPIKQNFAVTGSMDQKGRVQAIGGVNEKIEGFFDICQSAGLDGSHGVIIPTANIKDLMLSYEVRNAVAKKLFSIYAISHIDEGLELLTGIPAGVKNDKTSKYPPNSINGLIYKRWIENKPKNKKKAEKE